MKAPVLSIIVPCFNEEDVFIECQARLVAFLEQMVGSESLSLKSHVLFVDDGSKDNTWGLISQYSEKSHWLRGMKLSCNRGHQNAVFGGLMEAEGDILVSIDADLQDDINAIACMIKKYKEERLDIVYGVRSDRSSDTLFKRVTAQYYYKLLNILGVDVVYNHADFRLMSRRAVEGLRQFQEVNLFLRGMMPLVGFRTGSVEYSRSERFAGESKYPFKKMLALAWEGVTSLSIRPLRLITAFGLIVSVCSFIFGVVAIGLRLAGYGVAGWTSIIVAVFFLGGVQLLALGLIGEYIGKIFLEVKRRPRFLVEARAGGED